MNYGNLNLVLDQYIDNFEILNGVEHNEGMKWKAEKHFHSCWNIDAPNFAEMFKEAMKETSVLFDGSTEAPVAGLKSLMKKSGEESFVQNCFKELFVDDDGDLDARLNRIENFRVKINEKIDRYWHGSFKYPQAVKHVIGYLSLWDPDNNYMYKYSLIKEWNLYMEVSDEIGAGTNFSLAKYYALCDSFKNLLLTENNNVAFEKRRKRIIELHQERLNKIGYDLGEGYNFLVYDIIYCAKAYNFYNKLVKPAKPGEKRDSKLGSGQIDKVKSDIEEIEKQLHDLEDRKVDFTNIVGAVVESKKWGEGIVEAVTKDVLTVKFAEETKNLGLNVCVRNNILNFKDETVKALFEEEKARLAQIDEKSIDSALLLIQLGQLH